MNINNSSLLLFHAQTSMHPGSGTGTGAIDMPVQRERHTGWPLIPGSTLKGILRDYCRTGIAEKNPEKGLSWADGDPELECAFGPSSKGESENGRGSNAEDFGGALVFTDARILLFPVRSLTGLFAWVTCPAALDFFKRDSRLAKSEIKVPNITLGSNKEAIAFSEKLIVSNTSMVLEEFDFKVTLKTEEEFQSFADNLATKLQVPRIKTHLVVISDDMFTHFVKNATEVNARIALNYETKTAEDGALFYVETLPPETVFYSLMIASSPKGKRDKEGKSKPALENEQKVLNYGMEILTPKDTNPVLLQIGGEASTGKGICSVILSGGLS